MTTTTRLPVPASPPFQLGANVRRRGARVPILLSTSPATLWPGKACRVTHTDASGRCAAESVEFVLPAPGHKTCALWSPLMTRVAAAAYGAVVAEADRARCSDGYGMARDRDYPRASAAWCEEQGSVRRQDAHLYDATHAPAAGHYPAHGHGPTPSAPARPDARPWDAPSPSVSTVARSPASRELAPHSYAPPASAPSSPPDTVQLPPLRHVLAGMGMARTA
ncbi:hypothetical protein AMAG_01427 [Allomyces macrogynus ATCC 38327]|uniref:Uncharacterized protein n=1 Tax=Allomyces macrogynus (strain ATCC 38327) TaxID=578462 RepID=A0A0L0RZQ8_ALLM3|nr:hypothetical protein AMAG_01427 [Allomyces macrogynus ATCC 38327]|eukprot:KNE55539.1 hypothetical protein AMAG_01427 [Allomyces macrogynus ATCC 38327]